MISCILGYQYRNNIVFVHFFLFAFDDAKGELQNIKMLEEDKLIRQCTQT